MIDRIASDLGICRFSGESLDQYKCRVIYSAMACWIKAITLDRPVGYSEKNLPGVSRRHVYERSHMVLETMIKMFPETNEWFDLSADNDDPANFIRKRLINHGDLLNAGFETNLTLASAYTEQTASTFETVYGRTIGSDLLYNGVAVIKLREKNDHNPERENVKEWLGSFLKDASWSADLPNSSQVQYFNPLSPAKNNYEAWQSSQGKTTDTLQLIRTAVNENGYTYYLLKPKEKLVHRLDPFLQEQGFHIRVMCALRSWAKNNTTAVVTNYNDHIKIRFNALLPLRERIILESYAWPVRHINDKLEWVMGLSIWKHIRPFIEALDIQISEEKHG